ncbi:nitrous oxide reductase accessory protein NosL [Sulfurospirillum halorespirans]|uniref:Nitrous oxide reductase accessory protein NosL n=1 Tax=Sulfurospirillum halorespirans DSM 13726 TaxID=1193502 RepID=A0A1D7TGN3_9BACT|nr:nitrous oxide reductase accessory protein NosL [Sulfurospirillum halorespirans]AOO64146.1 nitrous oxide reductase accessory protein NosL [Sulfurospirillum halorespirans DSM 13726]
MNPFKTFFLLLMTFFVCGCDNKVDLGPKKVHWDRDMCERCKMVLSDRKFSAQVINPDNGKKYFFDDIGCVILWFKENSIGWKEKAVIWVNDAKTGEWIDARKAFYDVDNITPMAYGFGAHVKKEDIATDQEVVNFEEVTRRVIKIGK